MTRLEELFMIELLIDSKKPKWTENVHSFAPILLNQNITYNIFFFDFLKPFQSQRIKFNAGYGSKTPRNLDHTAQKLKQSQTASIMYNYFSSLWCENFQLKIKSIFNKT
jgi:hypothetical protein